MGFNQFKLGNLDAARGLIKSAHELCSELGDQGGSEVYAENLLALDHDQGSQSNSSWFRLSSWRDVFTSWISRWTKRRRT